ncbi:MAG: hypothetical protein SNJ82_09120, partial [Gemmataceae bacterium]
MSLYRNAGLLAAGLGLLVTGLYQAAAENPTIEQNRATARKQFQDGNFNDAYKLYRQIALDKGNPIPANDLEQGLQALARLG